MLKLKLFRSQSPDFCFGIDDTIPFPSSYENSVTLVVAHVTNDGGGVTAGTYNSNCKSNFTITCVAFNTIQSFLVTVKFNEHLVT